MTANSFFPVKNLLSFLGSNALAVKAISITSRRVERKQRIYFPINRGIFIKVKSTLSLGMPLLVSSINFLPDLLLRYEVSDTRSHR
jgi:hypothetical protein